MLAIPDCIISINHCSSGILEIFAGCSFKLAWLKRIFWYYIQFLHILSLFLSLFSLSLSLSIYLSIYLSLSLSLTLYLSHIFLFLFDTSNIFLQPPTSRNRGRSTSHPVGKRLLTEVLKVDDDNNANIAGDAERLFFTYLLQQ